MDELGRLRIFPFHDYILAPHACSLCPYNMCKVCHQIESMLYSFFFFALIIILVFVVNGKKFNDLVTVTYLIHQFVDWL